MMDSATTYSQRSARILLAAMLAVFVALAACFSAPVEKAYADSGSITVQYKDSETDTPISYLQVNAYKVADISGDNYTLTPTFRGYADILGWDDGSTPASNDAAWLQQQADTLDAYIRASAPDADAVASTGPEGTAVMQNLDEGLYLVLTIGDGVHLFSSSLVAISGTTSLDMTVKPKVENPPFNPVTEIKVVKHWSGDTASDRPASIKVQLVCDDATYGQPVELSDENAWTTTWDGLDASMTHVWNVIEVDPPAGYSIEINQDESGNFTITNTKNPTPPNNPPSVPPTTVTGKLPQTGQLWWPVPVLFCAGLIAVGAGRIVSSRSRG